MPFSRSSVCSIMQNILGFVWSFFSRSNLSLTGYKVNIAELGNALKRLSSPCFSTLIKRTCMYLRRCDAAYKCICLIVIRVLITYAFVLITKNLMINLYEYELGWCSLPKKIAQCKVVCETIVIMSKPVLTRIFSLCLIVKKRMGSIRGLIWFLV